MARKPSRQGNLSFLCAFTLTHADFVSSVIILQKQAQEIFDLLPIPFRRELPH
jgi:hypothetical protein